MSYQSNKFTTQWLKFKLDYLALFLVLVSYYGKLQWGNYIGDPDGYYHAKIALFLRQGILLKSLPWMQFSTLKDHFTDHHLLYHIFLAPFTWIQDPLIGVKVATVIFTVLMILVFYWLLKRMKIIWPWAWSIFFITLQALNFRLSLIKANSLSLLMLWLLMYALFNRQAKLLILIGFILVWLYGGWPLAILITLIYWLADFIYNKLHTNKLKLFWNRLIHVFDYSKHKVSNLKLLLSLLSGLILGLIVNPYWPHNLYFYYQQIFQIGIVNLGNQFPVGGEWYGSDFMSILSTAPHLFIITALVFILLFFNYQKISKFTWFNFILTFVFLILTVKSRRYIEYFLPFILLFTASGLTDLKNILQWDRVKNFWQRLSLALKIYLGLVLLIMVTLIMPVVYEKTITLDMSGSWKMEKFKLAATWLQTHTSKNSIIFHSSWDEWPLLFYYNDQNYYLVGLDPTFMYNYSPELNKLHFDITIDGRTEENIDVVKAIREKFQAEYIFVTKLDIHNQLIANIQASNKAYLTYDDDEVSIYKIY